jgi:hypothetical protein
MVAILNPESSKGAPNCKTFPAITLLNRCLFSQSFLPYGTIVAKPTKSEAKHAHTYPFSALINRVRMIASRNFAKWEEIFKAR